MSLINGATLLVVLVLGGGLFFIHAFKEWRHKKNAHATPLERSKEKWLVARAGSDKEGEAEKEWQDAAFKEMNQATSLLELYNAHERACSYISLLGQHKKKLCSAIEAHYDKRYDEIKAALQKKQTEKEVRHLRTPRMAPVVSIKK